MTGKKEGSEKGERVSEVKGRKEREELKGRPRPSMEEEEEGVLRGKWTMLGETRGSLPTRP